MEAHKFWLLCCTLTVTTVVALSGFSNHANGSRYLTRTEFLLLPNAIELLASLNLARDDSKVTENDPDPSVCGNLPSHYEGYLLHVSLETKSGCNCAITDGNLVTQPSSPNASLFSMGFAIDGCRIFPNAIPNANASAPLDSQSASDPGQEIHCLDPHYKSPSEVFAGLCNADNSILPYRSSLSLFGLNKSKSDPGVAFQCPCDYSASAPCLVWDPFDTEFDCAECPQPCDSTFCILDCSVYGLGLAITTTGPEGVSYELAMFAAKVNATF